MLRLVGGEGNDPQLIAIVQAASNIPVEVGKPLFSAATERMRPADRHGSMCEWATAFGLSMRMTNKRFGPIDGKPRDPNLAKGAGAQSMVEVVDMESAVKAAASLPEPPARRASDKPAGDRRKETAHA
jgi:hypothetical protein